MSNIQVMETHDDFVHKSKDKKMLFIGEKINKSWIQLPAQLGSKRANVTDTIEITCPCKKHLTNLYILDSQYSTFNCPVIAKGWAWINKPDNIAEIKKKGAMEW
jgi:hypothetical protein